MEGCGLMSCLKCGNETTQEQVFCEHCLEIMSQYPVKPGTPVQLPKRDALPTQKKQSRRRQLTPEDQIVHLKVLVRTLVALLGVVSVMLGIFAGLYFMKEKTSDTSVPSIGQNYTVDPTDNP